MLRKVLIAATVAAIGIVVVGVGLWWLWGVLTAYLEPKTATDRKDLVNIFVVIAAGVVGTLTAIAAVGNLYVSRKTLQQQRELDKEHRLDQERALEKQFDSTRTLEDQRSQDAVLQAYFEQMGALLTNHDLINTDRKDIRLLAEAQTLTVVARLDGFRKRSLVRFLYGAGLINRFGAIVDLSGADLRNVDFSGADLTDVGFSGVDLSGADFRKACLDNADLTGADLSNAIVSEEQLLMCHLEGATMPDGQKVEDWLNDKQGREKDEDNSGPS